MKNELTVLKSVRHCVAIAKKLDRECKRLALNSFCGCNFHGGTMGQVQAVSALVYKRDVTLQYYATVKAAIRNMPQGYRALLYAVYVKKTSKVELCQKYGVSLATVYRKLDAARKIFAKNLKESGAEEDWFATVYAALCKFYAALYKSVFDDAYAIYVKALDAEVLA